MNTIEYNWRYSFISVILSAVAIMIVIRAGYIQVGPHKGDQEDIIIQNEGYWRTVYPARGIIYDRWGHVLAGNDEVYEVGVELQYVKNPETIALTLSGLLHLDFADVYAAASTPYSADPENPAVYARLADNITKEQKETIEKLMEQYASQPASSKKDVKPPSLAGLTFIAHLARSYPEGSVGSNLLGFVNMEGVGFYGVESKFNQLLAGTPQRVWVPLDPLRAEEMPRIPNGASLVLTIDREIQAAMENILDKAIEDSGSSGGALLVSNPRNGEILAMAVTPRMDVNKYWEYEETFPPGTPFNRGVSREYEPGSVFKVLTMAAGLDSGAVKPDTSFLDTGVFEIGGIYINNWNMGAWGPQDMTGCMQHSLNVCLAWIASEIGAPRFYNYMQAFNIGRMTGIDLGSEATGRLKLPGDGDWYDADLGTNAFGQGVSVTPLQMIAAISAVANQGQMPAPHVVKSMVNNGQQYDTPIQIVGMPIKAKTARQLTEMLAISLEKESSDALIEGYRVAGKTGTAEIPTETGYSSSMTNASFVGWGPVDDPQFMVYVWLEKPASSPWGSIVAAPVFRDAVKELVVLLNIPPDNVRQRLQGQ